MKRAGGSENCWVWGALKNKNFTPVLAHQWAVFDYIFGRSSTHTDYFARARIRRRFCFKRRIRFFCTKCKRRELCLRELCLKIVSKETNHGIEKAKREKGVKNDRSLQVRAICQRQKQEKLTIFFQYFQGINLTSWIDVLFHHVLTWVSQHTFHLRRIWNSKKGVRALWIWSGNESFVQSGVLCWYWYDN